MITTSLELSKRLKEAWYPQGESHFYYEIDGKESRRVCRYSGELGRNVDSHYASPTAEEILEKLPTSITVDGKTLYLTIFDDRDWIGEASWDICYSEDRLFSRDIHVREKGNIGDGTFAGACAKMYLHLKQHNLL